MDKDKYYQVLKTVPMRTIENAIAFSIIPWGIFIPLKHPLRAPY